MKAVEEERGSKGKEREGRWGAWQPPEAGNLTPRTSRPSGQLTAISSMRWPTSCTAGGGRGRETCRESVCVREREGGGNKALFICRSFFKAGRSAEKTRCSDRETRGASRPEVQRAWLCRPPVRLRQSASVHSGSSSIYKRYKRISNLGGPLKNHPHRAARGGLSVGVTRVEFGQLAQEQFGPDLVLQLVDEGSSVWS